MVIAEAGMQLDEPRFSFGTAGDKWAAEIEDDPSGLWTDVSSDESDPAELARGILAALTHYSSSQS